MSSTSRRIRRAVRRLKSPRRRDVFATLTLELASRAELDDVVAAIEEIHAAHCPACRACAVRAEASPHRQMPEEV